MDADDNDDNDVANGEGGGGSSRRRMIRTRSSSSGRESLLVWQILFAGLLTSAKFFMSVRFVDPIVGNIVDAFTMNEANHQVLPPPSAKVALIIGMALCF